MAATTAWGKPRPAARRRRAYTRPRRAPRLAATRFYALLVWSAFVIYMLCHTVVTIEG